MKAEEIKVGGLYKAKISNRIVTVRVDTIREAITYRRNNYSGRSQPSQTTVYDVTNLSTKRTTTFRSAAKFRGEHRMGLPVPAGGHEDQLAKLIGRVVVVQFGPHVSNQATGTLLNVSPDGYYYVAGFVFTLDQVESINDTFIKCK